MKNLGLYVIGFLIISIPTCSAVEPLRDWPTFQHDYMRTGYSDINSTDLTAGGYLLWDFETEGVIRSSAAIADINDDGVQEVIVGSYDGNLYALSGLGREAEELWSFKTKDWISSSPAVVDLDGDGRLEAVFGSFDGRVYVVGSDGVEVWSFQTGGVVSSSPAVVDLDGDGRLEVVFGSFDGRVYCLSSSGVLKWSFDVGARIRSSPAVGDIDKDGDLDIIIGSEDGKIYAISSKGKEIWNLKMRGQIHSSPTISPEGIFIGSVDGALYRIDDGKIIWSFQTGGVVSSSPAVVDLDGDGRLEAVFGSFDGRVYVVGSDGVEVWSFQTGGVVSSSPAVVDLDGDGRLEVVFGSFDGRVYCLSSSGVLKWSFDVGARIRSSPAVGDIDKDGNPEIAIGGDNNLFYTIAIDRDLDRDGLFTSEEEAIGTDPYNYDTDGDGLFDGLDKYPLDYDNDGVPDAEDFLPTIKSVYVYIGIGIITLLFISALLAVRRVVRWKLLKDLKKTIRYLPGDIKKHKESISRMPEKTKFLIILSLVIGATGFMVFSFKTYLFINYDERFCLIGCHPATKVMQEPYYLWLESVHGKYTTCHDCHHASVTDNMMLVFKTILKRPIDIEKHAHIGVEKCLKCHASDAFLKREHNPLISPSVIELNSSVIPQRSGPSIAGHGVHVTREKIHCIECHAKEVHRFLPQKEICDKCHYDPRVGPPKEFIGEGEE